MSAVAANTRSTPRLLAVGSGGNRFIELLAEARRIRNATCYDWDCLAGISAGALLCGLISILPKNDLEVFNQRMDVAIGQFSHSAQASPFRPWIPLGGFANALLSVLLQKPSLFQGNRRFLREQFDAKAFVASRRRLMVGVYDNTRQQYTTVDSGFHTPTEMRTAIEASAAIPGVLPPVMMLGGHRCRDGGLSHTIPVNEIKSFVEKFGRDGPVHVDLLISGNMRAPPMSRSITVTSSLMDMCGSLVWGNLQKDLRDLVRSLLVNRSCPIREEQRIYDALLSGTQRNFKRPWGTLRVVSAGNLGERVKRTYFGKPQADLAKYLYNKGLRAADAALHPKI